MDREHAGRDARAMEDPIAAIFDLADSVDHQTPKIRRMLRYVRVFVSLWLLLDFFLIIALAAIGGGNPAGAFLLFIPVIGLLLGMRRVSGSTARLVLLILVIVFASMQILSIGGLLFVGIVLVALFVLGFIILELMQDLRSFFDYFALRHRVIQRVRQADPVVYVPEGKDAVHRILSHLAATSADVRGVMSGSGAARSSAPSSWPSSGTMAPTISSRSSWSPRSPRPVVRCPPEFSEIAPPRCSERLGPLAGV